MKQILFTRKIPVKYLLHEKWNLNPTMVAKTQGPQGLIWLGQIDAKTIQTRGKATDHQIQDLNR